MQTILVTGQTGIGKSMLLSALVATHKLAIIDPFVNTAKTWQEPDPGTCRGVVVDHVGHLQDAKAIVSAATTWCERNSGILWLCDIWLMHLEDQGIFAPDNAIELHLKRDVWPWPVTAAPGKRITCPFDQALLIAHQLAVNGHNEKGKL